MVYGAPAQPEGCRIFRCLWLREEGGLTDNDRPDKSGFFALPGKSKIGPVHRVVKLPNRDMGEALARVIESGAAVLLMPGDWYTRASAAPPAPNP